LNALPFPDDTSLFSAIFFHAMGLLKYLSFIYIRMIVFYTPYLDFDY
jgi:hypothetical protein